MEEKAVEHTLEFLLAFDGRIHWYEGGYHVRFEIKRVKKTAARPTACGIPLRSTDPDGVRLLGFDNAHTVRPPGSRFKSRPEAADHWHRTESDEGRPYGFRDAATLIEDFMNEVERVLTERGISFNVVADDNERRWR